MHRLTFLLLTVSGCLHHSAPLRDAREGSLDVHTPDTAAAIFVPASEADVCVSPDAKPGSNTVIAKRGSTLGSDSKEVMCLAVNGYPPPGGRMVGWQFYVEAGFTGTLRCKVDTCLSPSVRIAENVSTSSGVTVTARI